MNNAMNKKPAAKAHDLLEKAIAAFNTRFKRLKGLELSALYPAPDPLDRYRYDSDVLLRAGKRTVTYHAEIKLYISHAARQLLAMRKASPERPILLITNFVNPDMAEHLIKDGLEFIDAAGNAYINLGFLNIISKGNPSKERSPFPSPRLFKASGLKVVFALLSRPELISASLREIASQSGVSLGTAAIILDELKNRIFLIEDKKGIRRLIRKKELFENWATAYPEHLRPKIHLGRYNGEHGWWHEAVLDPALAQWGGEVAAARLTDYLFPQNVTVYLPRPHLNDFLMQNKLSLDVDGNVEVLEKFWRTDDPEHVKGTAHPMIVYADLTATGIERNIETAKIIYERDIARYLRED